MSQVHHFLKLSNGIKGESRDRNHMDELELESWGWGENQETLGDAGRLDFCDFSFTTPVNEASPRLLRACANGELIEAAQLACCLSGDREPQEFLTVRFANCLIRSIQTRGSAGAIPLDQISLSYGTVQYEYRPMRPNGSLGTAIPFGWNLMENRQI